MFECECGGAGVMGEATFDDGQFYDAIICSSCDEVMAYNYGGEWLSPHELDMQLAGA